MALIAAEEVTRHDEAPESTQELRRIQAFIEENLADSTLSPTTIAHHFYMSTRTLHRIFGKRGLSVSAWIKSRRLEACRRALVSPA